MKRFGRTTLFLAAFVVTLLWLCALTAIIVPTLLSRDATNQERERIRENEAIQAMKASLQGPIMYTYFSTKALCGYVTGTLTRLPPLSGSVSDRLEGQVFPRFPQIAHYYASHPISETSYYSLVPGGLISHIHPSSANSMIGVDIFVDLEHQLYKPTPRETMLTGRTSFIGPTYGDREWHLKLRHPVYNCTWASSTPPLDCFWGFVASVCNITHAIIVAKKSTLNATQDMDYLMYTIHDPHGAIEVIDTSLTETSPADIIKFLDDAKTERVHEEVNIFVSVKSLKAVQTMTSTVITIVIAAIVLSSLTLFGILCACVVYYTKEYDGRPYAPKLAPFAVLTIGPCWEEGLWDVASQELTAVSERLQRVLDKAMAAHHAYPIAQLHPYTSSYTTRSLDAAVHMAFSVLEELQRHPIDGPLRKAVGDEDGRLMVACAVHWCSDATVLMHSSGGAFRYDGPDMVAASQMWPLCAPNVVTLSEEAKRIARLMQGVVVTRCLHPILESGALSSPRPTTYTVTDPLSSLLAAAENASRQQVRGRTLSEAKHMLQDEPDVLGGAVSLTTDERKGLLFNDSLPEFVEPLPSCCCGGDALAHSLITPLISEVLEERLRIAFENHAVSVNVSYEPVRVVLYMVYSGLKLLFKPLAQPEREHIHRRMVVAFGVPMKDILSHLAARVTIHHVQNMEGDAARKARVDYSPLQMSILCLSHHSETLR